MMRPGDVFMLNAPFNGGTHLPDVTVITPVWDAEGAEILFYVGSRGHHADIGGRTPGSAPPDSRHIEEEGVLIDNFKLVDQGRFREAETRALLAIRPLSLPEHRGEHGRSRRPDRRERDRRARGRQDDRPVRAR